MDEQLLSIEAAFGDLEDPRRRTPAYDLTEMLVVALCAILSGAESWLAIQTWGDEKLEWLREYIELPQGIPSHDTFGRVFAALNPKQFEACFIRWMSPLFPALTGQVVAIDGKTVRRSFDRQNGRSPLHLVSAFAVEHGLVLAQRATETKRGELAVLPRLLDGLDLRGCLVSLDALACRPDVAQQITGRGGEYLLALKGNQKKAHAEVKRWFEANAFSLGGSLRPCCDAFDDGHGRLVRRRVFACTELEPLATARRWPRCPESPPTAVSA